MDKDFKLDEIERHALAHKDRLGHWMRDQIPQPEMFQPNGLYYEMRRENERYLRALGRIVTGAEGNDPIAIASDVLHNRDKP